MMSEVKRFVLWLIENDIAFTHISDAVDTFKEYERTHRTPASQLMGTDGTTEQSGKVQAYL